MKVGDLVKQKVISSYQRNDVGLILALNMFSAHFAKGGKHAYNQATVRWSGGKVQYFDVELLEAINASR